MKDRIKQLLIGGLKQSDVASIVGCTPAYISQLLKDEQFYKEVEAGRTLESQEKTEEQHIEQRYQNLEHKLITAISDDLPNAEFGQKLRALQVVGQRFDERRKIRIPAPITPNPHTSTTNTYNVINIALPEHVLHQPAPVVLMNENKEIISIDNQPLAPMSSDGVKNIFKEILERKKQQREQSVLIDAKILEEL